MNSTKWEEIRLAMLSLGNSSPKWRVKDIETGKVSAWDREWFYHFRSDHYKFIEWLEVSVDDPAQFEAVLAKLGNIHVPGEITGSGIKVFGYVAHGVSTSYLPSPNLSFKRTR